METPNITFGRQHILEASYNELRKMAKGKIELGRNPKLEVLRANLLEIADKEEAEAQKELARIAKKEADKELEALLKMSGLPKNNPVVEGPIVRQLTSKIAVASFGATKSTTTTKTATEGTTNIGSLKVGDTFKFPSADKVYTILEAKEEKGVPTVKVRNDKGTEYWMRNPNELNRQVICLGK